MFLRLLARLLPRGGKKPDWRGQLRRSSFLHILPCRTFPRTFHQGPARPALALPTCTIIFPTANVKTSLWSSWISSKPGKHGLACPLVQP